jgi:hypothetical protein
MQAIISECNFRCYVQLVFFPLENVDFLWFSGPKRMETNVLESSGCVPHVLISTKSGSICWHLLSGDNMHR